MPPSTPSNGTFATRLRAALTRAGIEPSELATAIGYSPRQISRWLAGEARPRPGTMRPLAKALRVQVEWLASGSSRHAGNGRPSHAHEPQERAPRRSDRNGSAVEGAICPAKPVSDLVIPRAVDPREVPDDADLDHPALIFNRELSWLDFNARVLAQALDARTPLLERVRFLGIAANNLDEFVRKRVGGLKRQEAARLRTLSPDGRTPTEQLRLIRNAIRPVSEVMVEAWEEDIRPALEREAGVVIRKYRDLTEEQRDALDERFRREIFPILTPLAVDPGHPFPFISNLSLSLAVTLRHPARQSEHFARLKVPISRGRWLPVPGEELHFLPLEELIRYNISELFRGMEVESASVFRITRNADLRRNEEEADDLLAMISEEVRERRFAEVVRLEVDSATPEHVRTLLMRELEIEVEDMYVLNGLLELSDLEELAELPLPEHQYPRWEPIVPIRLRHEGESEDAADIFAVIRHRDLLVHHPYENFSASVQHFIEKAAEDARVLAIKMTLYRTGEASPIVAALLRAAENGKQVAVLIEVKARFDEEQNIELAQELEKSGVHVTYGLVGLKTHAKTMLVVREDGDGLRAYCHVGTGNYNPTTARIYTDYGLLTASPAIGADQVNLFHYLTGYAPEQHYNELLVAPRDMRPAFLDMIAREIGWQERHGTGRIIAKMNAIDDPVMIRALYEASRAGVSIDLIVRGHCRLRPGFPGYSENIRVTSIIGRFLEHSRVYYFGNNGEPELFIGSADWQRRNLEDRIEVVVPVSDEDAKGRLIRMLQLTLDDNRLAWDLRSDGRYVQRTPSEGEPERALHDELIARALQRSVEEDPPWDL
jgi:polyphosphate kinase